MDNLWKQHLKDIEYLKEFIGLRAYKQGDPFQDFQQEGFELFQDMRAQVITTRSELGHGSWKQRSVVE